MPLRRAQKRAARNREAVEVTPIDAQAAGIAAVHTKVDTLCSRVEELRLAFDRKRLIDDQRWERMWPRIESQAATLQMSSIVVAEDVEMA